MEAVEGTIQEVLSLTIHPHRSQAPPSSHSLRVSTRRHQSFKRLLGGALLPQIPPPLSALRVQRLGLYHLVNPRWYLPKSLPAALCIHHSVGQMLRRLQCYLEDCQMRLLQVSVYPDHASDACHFRLPRPSMPLPLSSVSFLRSTRTRWSQGVNRAQSMSGFCLGNHGNPSSKSYARIGPTSKSDLSTGARWSTHFTLRSVWPL